jgi:hypothetical protein
MNPTVEEIKSFYKNSRDLIKINKHFPDERVESEYFPDVRTWKADEDEREEDSFINRAEQLQEAYENRTRFAREVSVLVGREHELRLSNRGYCVVTFSTSEECQNYYFTEGHKRKVELVGEREDF